LILLLDVGNTRIKWGVWRDARWWEKGHLPTGEIEGLADRLQALRLNRVAVSCVAGDDVRARLRSLLETGGRPVFWLQSSAHGHGLHNRYSLPERLGPDRYAMLVACQRLGWSPCVVVGAGTAVTVDALTRAGDFLGGLILPGAGLMRQSLRLGTAGVERVSGKVAAFPTNTEDAVETGIWRALSGSIEHQRGLLKGYGETDVTVVLSGGDGEVLSEHVNAPTRVVEDLVLEGLRWIVQEEVGENG
jgi:type III pantothenate kinase